MNLIMTSKKFSGRGWRLDRQAGVAMFTVILAIVAVMGALAATFVSTPSLSGASSGQNYKILASGLISQGATLVQAFQNMEAKGNSASTITFDMNTTTGLFHPTAGTTSYQKPPATAFLTTVPSVRQAWVYKGTALIGNGVGTSAGENSVVVRGLLQKVCQEINLNLYGSATIPTATGKAASTFVADAATDAATPITDTTAVDLSAVAGISRWTAGCVASSDGEYVYFAVAEPG